MESLCNEEREVFLTALRNLTLPARMCTLVQPRLILFVSWTL